jgi:hypothetical protein
MRILRILTTALLLASALAIAQVQPVTQNITATAQCVPIRASNNSTVGIIVSGTWSGTFTPNVQISTAASAPTVAKKVVPVDSTTAQSTVTANGGYRADVAGFTQFNFCSTGTWTSGTAIVTLYAVPSPAASTVASGSGGITGTLVSGDYPTATGTGTVGDSTVVAGPYACEWNTVLNSGSGTPTTGSTANRATVWGVFLATPCTSTKVTFETITGDTSGGTYDVGLYTYAGNLAAHIGNTAAASGFTGTSTIVTINWTGTAILQPGKYYLAITCSATTLCATFAGASSTGVTFISNSPVVVTSGGTLPATITPPSDSVTYASAIPVMMIR